MNPYVGREEKEHLVRITALAIMLDDVICVYEKLKSTDKQFLAHLRKSRTWGKKAISCRESYLNLESKRDLCRSVGNMRLMLLPSDKAKKEHRELMNYKSVFPFEIDDFNDLYAELIETTCKFCARSDFNDCQARRVMTKYGVFPYNPAATETCQFSYMEPAAALAAKQEETAPISEPKQAVAGKSLIRPSVYSGKSGYDDPCNPFA